MGGGGIKSLALVCVQARVPGRIFFRLLLLQSETKFPAFILALMALHNLQPVQLHVHVHVYFFSSFLQRLSIMLQRLGVSAA